MDNHRVYGILIMVTTILSTKSYLTVISNSSTCLVGTYSRIVDTDCYSSIDGNISAYTPPTGTGWIVVTMPTVAMVSYVGLLYSIVENDYVQFTVHIPSTGGEARGSLNITSMPGGTYYASFALYPLITNSLTLTWKTFQPLDILDIRIIGKTEGIRRVTARDIYCDNYQQRQCLHAMDGNILTTLFLASGTTLTAHFSTEESISHLAFYSHQLQQRASPVTLKLAFIMTNTTNVETVGIHLRNQGWEQEGKWQIVALPKTFTAPLTMTAVLVSGGYATLSEIQFFFVEREPNVIRQRIPPLPYDADFIHKLNTEYARWSGTNANHFTTRKANIEAGELTSTPLEELTQSVKMSTSFLESATSLVITDVPSTSGTLLPVWFIYFSIIIVIVIAILVISVVVAAVARLRHRQYAPNRRHRIVIRNTDLNTSPSVSVVTPTRGYFHLTLNSQSSDLEPYNGVSPLHTTTFAQNRFTQFGEEADGPGKVSADDCVFDDV